jgi:23S rRNA (guanosine2251-2'-O)-methyltransferase
MLSRFCQSAHCPNDAGPASRVVLQARAEMSAFRSRRAEKAFQRHPETFRLAAAGAGGTRLPKNSPSTEAGRRPADNGRWLYGRHAVAAALANPERRWRRLAVLAGQEEEATALIAGAQARRRGDGEAIRVLDRKGFATLLPEAAVHQGLALEVEPLAERDLDDVVRHTATAALPSIIVVLDQLSDPQNVGSVLRSAAAFGALAVVVPTHRSAVITGALAKAASGAVETVPLVRVVNLARALDSLKEAGFWICGLDTHAPKPLAAFDLGERIAIVLGSEGRGMRRLVRERCDFLVRLPTRAAQPSLNVSNAAAVALYALGRGCRPGSSGP